MPTPDWHNSHDREADETAAWEARHGLATAVLDNDADLAARVATIIKKHDAVATLHEPRCPLPVGTHVELAPRTDDKGFNAHGPATVAGQCPNGLYRLHMDNGWVSVWGVDRHRLTITEAS